MIGKFAEQIIHEAPIGYAFHRIVFHENDHPVDYEFIDINTTFENITGLKQSSIVGKRVSEIIPGIKGKSFQWIGLYGQIDLNSGNERGEQYSEVLGKWFETYAYSLGENYLVIQITDISEKKNQINELESKIQLFQNAIDGANVGIWEWDVKTGEQAINERWAGIIGYTINELEPISIATFRKFVHPKDLIEIDAKLIKIFSQESNHYRLEFRMKHKDGKWIWIESRGIVNSWSSSGKPLLVCGTHVDITKNKQIEEILKESEARYKKIINAAKDSILVIDAKGSITMWNNSAELLFGYTAKEILGENAHRLLAASSCRDGSIKAFTEPQHLEPGSEINQLTEISALRKSGEIFPAELSLSVIKMDDGWHTIGVIRDITKRKFEEDASKENERRLIAAQQIAHVGNWELNLDTGQIWASEEAFNIYGIEHTSSTIPVEDIKRRAGLEYRQLLDDGLINLISKNEKYDIEFKINNWSTTKDHFIHSIAVLQRDKEGNARKVIGTIQDITEQKQRQEELIYLGYHDQLTGLYNRRFYEEELSRVDVAINLPITLVMCDVNGLKLINDSFGHALGDVHLKKVAEVIRAGCRCDDIIARHGGDEFAIILSKTNSIEADNVIRRIKLLALAEKVGAIDISISLGFETKIKEEEDIQVVSKNAEDHMYRHKLYESGSARSKTIDLIMNTLYEKNNREMLHSKRVSQICEIIAKKLHIDQDGVNQIRIAGLMHDIGKIGIDEKILNKTDKLTIDEWEEIRRHSEIGYRILSSVNEFSEIAEFVLEHQERWDGTGYPKGLKGEEISIEARIIAIADAYDAMTGERTYGKIFTKEEAIDEISKCSGSQFDPEIAKMFLSVS